MKSLAFLPLFVTLWPCYGLTSDMEAAAEQVLDEYRLQIEHAQQGEEGDRGLLLSNFRGNNRFIPFDRCDNNEDEINNCGDGFDCTRTVGGSFCIPMQCLQELVHEEVKTSKDVWFQQVLALTGIEADDTDVENLGPLFFNQTTLKLGADAVLKAGNHPYILNPGIREALGQALETVELGISDDRLQAGFSKCVYGSSDRRLQISPEPYYMTGIEFAFGLKFLFQELDAFSAGGSISTACFGAGPEIGFHFHLGVGWLFADDKDLLDQCALMMDANAGFIYSGGVAAGFTFPRPRLRLEINAPFGLGLGLGAYGCVTY